MIRGIHGGISLKYLQYRLSGNLSSYMNLFQGYFQHHMDVTALSIHLDFGSIRGKYSIVFSVPHTYPRHPSQLTKTAWDAHILRL